MAEIRRVLNYIFPTYPEREEFRQLGRRQLQHAQFRLLFVGYSHNEYIPDIDVS